MDNQTIERLYREHNETVRRIISRRLGGELADVAEDALSEAWMKLATKPDDYLTGDPRAWLNTVATRWAFDQLDPRTCEFDEARYNGDDSDSVFATVAVRDQARELIDWTRTETPATPNRPHATLARRRAVLARMLGYSYREIGEMTGTSYRHVNRSVTEGRALAVSSSRYNEAR
jgi:DNA-directed RNA polymerase specialized sigma24 family protein